MKMFASKDDSVKKTFYFQMDGSCMSKELHPGKYMLGVFQIDVERDVFASKMKKTSTLYPVLFDVANDVVIHDQELAEEFMGKIQTGGDYEIADENAKLSEEAVENMRSDLIYEASEHVKAYRKDIEMRMENDRQLRLNQTLQYFDSRVKSLASTILTYEAQRETASMMGNDKLQKKAESVIRLMTANLRDLNARKEQTLGRINQNANVKVGNQLIALNLVNVK